MGTLRKKEDLIRTRAIVAATIVRLVHLRGRENTEENTADSSVWKNKI